jgi:hypothetical protein
MRAEAVRRTFVPFRVNVLPNQQGRPSNFFDLTTPNSIVAQWQSSCQVANRSGLVTPILKIYLCRWAPPSSNGKCRGRGSDRAGQAVYIRILATSGCCRWRPPGDSASRHTPVTSSESVIQRKHTRMDPHFTIPRILRGAAHASWRLSRLSTRQCRW